MEEFYNLSIRLNDTPAAAAEPTSPILTNFTLQLLNNSNESYEAPNLYTRSLINTSPHQQSIFITNLTTLLLTLLSTAVNYTVPTDSVNLVAASSTASSFASSQFINTSLLNVSRNNNSLVPQRRTTSSRLDLLHLHAAKVTLQSRALSSSTPPSSLAVERQQEPSHLTAGINAIRSPDDINIYAADRDKDTIKYLPADYAYTGDDIAVNSSADSFTTAPTSPSSQVSTGIDLSSPLNLTSTDGGVINDALDNSTSHADAESLGTEVTVPHEASGDGSWNFTRSTSLEIVNDDALSDYNELSNNVKSTVASTSPIVNVHSAHHFSNAPSTSPSSSASSWSSSSSPSPLKQFASTPASNDAHEMSGVVISVVNVSDSLSLSSKLTHNASDAVSLYNASLTSSLVSPVASSSSRLQTRTNDKMQAVESSASIKSAHYSPLFATVTSYHPASPYDDADVTEQDLVKAASAVNSSTDSQADTHLTSPSREYWALLLTLLPILAIFGNTLVIISVYSEKSLRGVTNYFIVSLAFADLFVGAVVMPFAVYFLVSIHPS